MKLLRHSLHGATLLVAAGVLLSGCARFKSEPLSPARISTNVDARTLADAGLKRFVEATLKRRMEPWPPESWDLPKLTLAAWYFRSDAEKAVMWQVRANVRTNLLHYAAARCRLELLNELSEFQSEIIRRGRTRQTENEISWDELSAIHTHYANTLLARLDALEEIMQARLNLAEAIGVPVRALLHVELNYDFSRAATNEFAPAALRRLKSQNRSDIAKIDRSAAALRAAQRHLATCLGRLSARETKRNAIAAQVKDGGQTEIEVLLLETHVAAARLAVFDAQVQVQHALGSLEDAVQQPVELFLRVRRTRKFGNNSSGKYTVQTIWSRSLFHPTEQRKEK